ncbi:MAG TPA: bifunctional proline dehydrogenase/L-glutamate gamma-semialdehyde dehydrogenase PutA [Caulobacteraceae bacterium]|jgi:RHH-type proline utilization regulon transcriptional repressor/proline dehydrogenase/delta 1-pyrroline-5-carboxylate dehydrogenase|nr:bifunctional proline dehydrogenase/L-glutamate gamma-semialdehyde dehydrogenase PutA [Caulobacteraceae bacterium]
MTTLSVPDAGAIDLAVARAAIAPLYRLDEHEALEPLARAARLRSGDRARVLRVARTLLARLREPGRSGWVDQFLREYSLSSEEGAALLGLAEAYLRVPDAGTADALIRDKLLRGDWKAHLGAADSAVVNSATLGLILAQSLAAARTGSLKGLVARMGEPAIRAAVATAMQRMGEAFVLGRDIEEALRRADRGANKLFRYSFDMLGEGARTGPDAEAYFQSYVDAVQAVGRSAGGGGDLFARDSVSVKLSALHPRYEPFQAGRCVPELTDRLIELSRIARDAGVGLTVDAEEAERLEMSLSIVEAAARDPSLAGWDGLGMAIQAYQRRAPGVIAWADDLAAATGRRLMVRLVKGAYWDSEIKRAQERGLADYPVFTRKTNTDVSYLAGARALLGARRLYPAFATHNALTVATVLEWAGKRGDFEFQRLHGMGEGLYEGLMDERGLEVRVYAPVGGYRDLLAYLVRRLLENGANTSFVHQIADREISDEELLADPVERALGAGLTPHPAIVNPRLLYGPERPNAAGVDLSDETMVAPLLDEMRAALARPHLAAPLIAGAARAGAGLAVVENPAAGPSPGEASAATPQDVDAAIAGACRAQPAWDLAGAEFRAAVLERLGDLIERDRAELMALLTAEAGKTLADGLSEVREAVDYCRYYAVQARRCGAPLRLPGPTGELDELRLAGRGVFACISPWNFPLAIFSGQALAALVMGNAVVAKPAPQTPLIAARAVALMIEAGVPAGAIALLPGGADVGARLVADPRVAGVAFTGSTASAKRIARALLEDDARPIVPLIAETGGINAMLVDSTALAEQVVADVVTSAFLSAGQRCSALRLLCLHEDIAPGVVEMLCGAMDQLIVGDPADPSTDVGPVIDAAARAAIEAHVRRLEAKVVHRTPVPAGLGGHFVAPTLIRLDRIEDLDAEIFGPVLHVATFPSGGMDAALRAINATGYGLTLGVHSRIAAAAEAIRARARVGNLYVNRSMTGAVVGVQPFGGEGLSGTGPKAGGPHYLPRFAVERTWCVDTTSAGGNASLLGLED